MGNGPAAAMVGLLLLAACAETGAPAPSAPTSATGAFAARAATGGPDPGAAAIAISERAGQALLEAPFARGPLAAVTTERGEVETYRLVPCQGGRAACLGSAQGPAGALAVTADHTVVSGIGGRTFWLSPGGDGYLQVGDALLPLAWNAVGNGTGEGVEAVLDRPVPHGGPHRTHLP